MKLCLSFRRLAGQGVLRCDGGRRRRRLRHSRDVARLALHGTGLRARPRAHRARAGSPARVRNADRLQSRVHRAARDGVRPCGEGG